MPDDPNRPVVLTSVPSEAQAVIIVAALDERGIQARTQGALTSAFRAEVPGEVQVLVRQADLDRARAIIEAIDTESGLD